jgi:hypothetical protein
VPTYPVRKRPRMPDGVIVSVIFLILWVALRIFGFLFGFLFADHTLELLFSTGIGITLIVFLCRGEPLARLIAFSGFLIISETTMELPADMPAWVNTLTLIIRCMPLLIIIGLLPKSSKAFFDLLCPACGSGRVHTVEFLWSKLRC